MPGTRNVAAKSCVGIFWLLGGRLIFDMTILVNAEAYGNHKTHAASHVDYWSRLQRNGQVSRDTEYEQLPRGRVVFETKTRQFTIFADRCILRRNALVAQIISEMNLPRTQTTTSTDLHYRCSDCLRPSE